jgi:hypothetical protein
MESEPCGYCGNEPDECVCYLAQDFPDDPIEELDTDYLDWEFYEEEENNEGGRQENLGEAGQDEGSE